MSITELNRRSTQALLAVSTAFALTTVHHLYGGIVDGSVRRLTVPLIMAPAFAAAVVLLLLHRRTRRRGLLIAYASITMIVFVGLLGLLHGGYAHLYKDLVFLSGASERLYQALNPDEHFPPDNLFFEVTGLLDLGAAILVGITTIRMLTASRWQHRDHDDGQAGRHSQCERRLRSQG